MPWNIISTSLGSSYWYIDRFQSLMDYCIQQGVPTLTMDDLYRLQSGDITISAPLQDYRSNDALMIE